MPRINPDQEKINKKEAFKERMFRINKVIFTVSSDVNVSFNHFDRLNKASDSLIELVCDLLHEF